MGMFDDIKCSYPLPTPEAQGVEFQTKSLACDLDEFEITADGRLVQWVWDYDAGGKRIQSSRRTLDKNYHGILHFHGFTGRNHKDPAYRWYEFEAKFTDGRLVSITGGASD